jgi:hypothetical protein
LFIIIKIIKIWPVSILVLALGLGFQDHVGRFATWRPGVGFCTVKTNDVIGTSEKVGSQKRSLGFRSVVGLHVEVVGCKWIEDYP